jgi:CBS domain-containing protein
MQVKVLDTVSALLSEKGGGIWSIEPDATVYNALQMMAEHGIGALLVIDHEKFAGVVSERDYARKVILKGRSSQQTKVSDIMSSPPITISPDCTVDEAMRVATERRIRHLPVIDSSGAILGILSIGDLVKWIITSHEKTIDQLQSYISG